jgi:hypothetical protein
LAGSLLMIRNMTKLSVALLAVAACASQDSLPSTSDEVTSAIEKENGGLTMDDEAPLFDSADLFDAAAIEAEAVETDAMAGQVADMQAQPNVRVRNVFIVWGHLPADPDATGVRDWTGRLDVNRGGMKIQRRIAFEPQTGDRVLPRTVRTRIDFISHTGPAADGLVLTVVDPTPGDATPLSLTYTPADGSTPRTLELRELADGPVITDLGDGNRIIVSARDLDRCDNGLMRGRWHALAQNHGIFLGVFGDQDGGPVGHVRGVWGQRRNGDEVFFGKFIDRDGHFRGILAGQYENGTFQGRWLTRAGDHGLLGGVYFAHDTLRGGGFIGRWGETGCRR